MDLRLIMRVLALRRALRDHEHWTRTRLEQRRQEASNGAGEWQIVQEAQEIKLLVARPSADFDGAAVLTEIARALAASGAEAPALRWAEVDAIPRTGTGKAPLIRAAAKPN